jgi:Predicted permease
MGYRLNFFKYAAGIVLILFMLFLLKQLDGFFIPLQKFMAALFFPILIAGLFYYLLRPLVRLGERARLSKTIAILSIFLFLTLILVFMGRQAGTMIEKQFTQLLADLPGIIDLGRNQAEHFLHTRNLGTLITGRIGQPITAALQKALPYLAVHILDTLAALTSITATLVLAPFILFYFLRDDDKFSRNFLQIIPKSYHNEVRSVIEKTDQTLASYITGQAILAIILGLLLYAGYLLIGVHYPLVLALFALVTSFIPMFGAIIGIIPALLIGLTQNPWLVVKIGMLALLIHLIEGNFIFPHLIGKRLKIHPLTIIILFLAAAPLFGFIGMLIAVPVYAVAKIIITSGMKLYRESTEHDE